MTVPTMTSQTLRPADRPTLYFIGVTTGRSSIQRVFPRWAEHLGLGDVHLQGVDLPLHADPDQYRRVVEFIASDELSRGALITTHKIDLYRACADLFDTVDAHARMMGEASCLTKTESGLHVQAKDPVTCGLALDAFIPPGYWKDTGAEVLSMGAGGSTTAISWYLSQPERGADRPVRFTVTDTSAERLHHLHAVHARLPNHTPFDYVFAPTLEHNDRALGRLPAGSLVVNATGLGKDGPGSPITAAARFPEQGRVWELNYRGDLVFLDQARAQQEERQLRIEDGWVYFLHGWMQHIAEVFDIAIPAFGEEFDALSDLARAAR
ncbi:shikimate dehydrogenase family protein [Phytoactinopolyspora halotolerans]|uniref:Shikimate dehydrogenase n=1 Tax=Phytoactinopolyspora halotolerans TaxID=1981512 RepID=A0A6L9S4R4_9ACTN|nr:shikimate dehydrogenase [Phytoactinopolyspora halotolerans]NED99750.1 shikimate dehydrogenase [Phytoactinopolyspora halotolerans]